MADDSFEVLSCSEFYPKFLDPISEEVRRELISVIHELSKTGAPSENARDKCEDILTKVERELGASNFICEIVAKELAECLRKLGLVTDTIDFINNRLQRLGSQDFGTFLTLGSIYELTGEYSSALKQRKAGLKLAELTGDPILIALSLVKQACDIWHLHSPDEARSNVASCLEKLENANVSSNVNQLPFSESVQRLIDLYKTLGYIHRFLEDRSRSAEFYIKALNIVNQDVNAHVHIMKLETQIACEYSSSKLGFKTQTSNYALNAHSKIRELIDNESYMLFHTLTVTHAMSRVGHSLQQADLTSTLLPIREELYNVAEKYMSQNHPELARIAADTALLCANIGRSDKETEYTEKAKQALEECDNDLEFLKLNVREISDAWKSLGLMYSKKSGFFREAEQAYKEALQVNIRVYGTSHPRLARLYRSFGHLYLKQNKFSEAISMFTKCMSVNDKFSPNDAVLRKQLKKQINICKNLEKKYYN